MTPREELHGSRCGERGRGRDARTGARRHMMPGCFILVAVTTTIAWSSWSSAAVPALFRRPRHSAETTEDGLRARIADLEAERDLWMGRAESQRALPATMWPVSGRRRKTKKSFGRFDTSRLLDSFNAVGDRLIDEICTDLSERFRAPPGEVAWMRRMLEENVRGGKMNRGLTVIEAGLAIFAQSLGRPASNDDTIRLAILGWCAEFLQTSFLIADDIMDASETRRGKPCWYRREDVQMIAVNDAMMLENLVYKVLKRHFVSEPYYDQLVDLFLETTFQTELGELMDIQTQNLQLDDLTVERWSAVSLYKTALYSFYMPVAIGMIAAGIEDEREFTTMREIMISMGVYFQAQDDFLDAFTPPEKLGKIGTDIQDKKCSWLFVNAYPGLASASQRKVFDEHYGKCKAQSSEEELVKNVYRDLGMQDRFKHYEQNIVKQIEEHKANLKHVPWSVVDSFLAKIYKRGK